MELLSRISLVKKLRIFLYITLLAFLLFAAVLFTYLFGQLRSDSEARMESLSSYASTQLLFPLRIQHTLVSQLSSDFTLKSFLDTDYSKPTGMFAQEQAKIDIKLQQIGSYLPGSVVYIYNDNPTVQSSNAFLVSLEEARQFSWINPAVFEGEQSAYWSVGDLRRDGVPYLICYRAVHSNDKPYGLRMIVAIGVRTQDLRDYLSELRDGTSSLLIHESGDLITATNGGFSQESLDALRRFQPESGLLGRLLRLDGALYTVKKTALTRSELDMCGWQLVVVSPFSTLLDGFVSVLAVWLLLAAVILAVLVTMTRMVSRNIAVRTTGILRRIDQITSEDYECRGQLGGSDEFARIFEKLNALAGRLSYLIERVYKFTIELNNAQIEKQQIMLKNKEAEIMALQNQINPHYFFNTLESIRMNLLLAGDEKNSEMIQFFAESLHTYDKSPYDFATIQEELSFLKKYIRLQNYRFNGQLRFDVEVDDSLLSCRLPRFLLQPLLENAVVHGFKKKYEHNLIQVSIRGEANRILIEVTDNGEGMGEPQLSELNARLRENNGQADASKGSIGLINISRRLRLLYGEDCGIEVACPPGGGTQVRVSLVNV